MKPENSTPAGSCTPLRASPFRRCCPPRWGRRARSPPPSLPRLRSPSPRPRRAIAFPIRPRRSAEWRHPRSAAADRFSFARYRINSASAVRAANRNGVAPIVFKLVNPTETFLVIRALTFAPLSTSFFTNSRLVMLPDSVGSRDRLSPRPGLRTHGTTSHVHRVARPDGIGIGLWHRAAQRRCQLVVCVAHRKMQRRSSPARAARQEG